MAKELTSLAPEMITHKADMSVPFFRYEHIYRPYRKEFLALIDEVCSRGAFILQKDVREFERSLAAYVGSSYALGVANCSDGLTLCLKAAGISTGDEVIFSSHTFVATAAAIHSAGAKPVPVECGPDHLIDPYSVASAISPRTRAVIPTHLNGRVCEMDSLLQLVDKYNLLLIEDAAQSLGAKFKGRFAGGFGQAGVFSFYPAKSLGCFGDGGAIVTDNADLYEVLGRMHNHGRLPSGRVTTWGMNSRLDNLHAAVLSMKLAKFDDEIVKRRELASIYQSQLHDVAELVLPPGPDSDPDRFDTFQNYEIEAEDRERLVEYLSSKHIGTLVQWSGWAVHQFTELGFDCHLPNTDRLLERIVLLPMNTSLSVSEVSYVCDCIREFYCYQN